MKGRPPERVAADGVTIRRWKAEDAGALHDMILGSLDHLRPWMSWTDSEPLTLSDRTEKIGEWCSRWDFGEDFPFAITSNDRLAGACGLHRRIGADGLELGYWVAADQCGVGIGTRAARALVEAAFSIDGICHVEIHHDLANVASGRIPDKLGFSRVGESPDEVVASGEVGIDVVWRLDRPG